MHRRHWAGQGSCNTGDFFGMELDSLHPRARIVLALSVMVPVALGAVVVLLFFQPMFWLVFTFGWMVFPAFGLLASGLTGLASTPSGKQLERDSTAAKERELLGVLKDRGELTPAPAAAILLPAAFFLSVLSPDATEPNSFIYLAYLGAVSLATGLLVLGIGLMRKPRALQER